MKVQVPGTIAISVFPFWGWSGGAKVLGKLTVQGRPTKLRAYCACGRCVWMLFGHFFPGLSFFFLPLWETAIKQSISFSFYLHIVYIGIKG